MQQLDETAERLTETHPDQEEPITAKRAEIDEAWNALQGRVSGTDANLLQQRCQCYHQK